MNLPNFAALILLVLGLVFLFFSLLLPISTLVKDPMETIEDAAKFLPIDKPPIFNELIGEIPWILGVGLFFFLAVPGLCLTAGGYVIWRTVSRPRMLEKQRQAAMERERESMLQDFLTEVLGRLAEVTGGRRAQLYERLVKLQPHLDPGRQLRVQTFLRRSGLDRGDIPWPPHTAWKPHRAFAESSNLAHALALMLFLLAGVGFLWGLMIGLISGPMIDLYKSSLGLDLDARDGFLTMAFIWVLSVSPAVLGFGCLGMARLDRGLAERWGRGRKEAEKVLLEGYRQQVEALLACELVPASDRSEVHHVATALTSVTLPELDGAGRRECLELLHELGLTRKEPPILEPGIASFAGIDLAEIDLRGARLAGVDFAGTFLSRAVLAEADLSGACFVAADLRQADLTGAKLWRADLSGARLQNAQLVDADLREAGLWDANLWQADFSGADLEGARMHESQRVAMASAVAADRRAEA